MNLKAVEQSVIKEAFYVDKKIINISTKQFYFKIKIKNYTGKKPTFIKTASSA